MDLIELKNHYLVLNDMKTYYRRMEEVVELAHEYVLDRSSMKFDLLKIALLEFLKVKED
jgi:hypothetical protein